MTLSKPTQSLATLRSQANVTKSFLPLNSFISRMHSERKQVLTIRDVVWTKLNE